MLGSSSLTYAPVIFERRAYHTRSSRGVSARRTFATGAKQLHTRNIRLNLTSLAYADMASEHGDRKVERESYSRYDQHSDVHH